MPSNIYEGFLKGIFAAWPLFLVVAIIAAAIEETGAIPQNVNYAKKRR